MIHLLPSKDDIDQAIAEAESLGSLNRSIRRGGGNIVGLTAELTIARIMRAMGARRDSTKNHDLLVRGLRMDVKSKERNVLPQPHFMATVPEIQGHQTCDGYLFTSVQVTRGIPEVVTLCGWLPRCDFERMAAHFRKGDLFPENGWKCSLACKSVPYSSLLPVTKNFPNI